MLLRDRRRLFRQGFSDGVSGRYPVISHADYRLGYSRGKRALEASVGVFSEEIGYPAPVFYAPRQRLMLMGRLMAFAIAFFKTLG